MDRQSQLPWSKGGGGSVERDPWGSGIRFNRLGVQTLPCHPSRAMAVTTGKSLTLVSRLAPCAWPPPSPRLSVTTPGWQPVLSSHSVENKNNGRGDSAKRNSPGSQGAARPDEQPRPLKDRAHCQTRNVSVANTTGVRSSGSGRCSGRRVHSLLAALQEPAASCPRNRLGFQDYERCPREGACFLPL